MKRESQRDIVAGMNLAQQAAIFFPDYDFPDPEKKIAGSTLPELKRWRKEAVKAHHPDKHSSHKERPNETVTEKASLRQAALEHENWLKEVNAAFDLLKKSHPEAVVKIARRNHPKAKAIVAKILAEQNTPNTDPPTSTVATTSETSAPIKTTTEPEKYKTIRLKKEDLLTIALQLYCSQLRPPKEGEKLDDVLAAMRNELQVIKSSDRGTGVLAQQNQWAVTVHKSHEVLLEFLKGKIGADIFAKALRNLGESEQEKVHQALTAWAKSRDTSEKIEAAITPAESLLSHSTPPKTRRRFYTSPLEDGQTVRITAKRFAMAAKNYGFTNLSTRPTLEQVMAISTAQQQELISPKLSDLGATSDIISGFHKTRDIIRQNRSEDYALMRAWAREGIPSRTLRDAKKYLAIMAPLSTIGHSLQNIIYPPEKPEIHAAPEPAKATAAAPTHPEQTSFRETESTTPLSSKKDGLYSRGNLRQLLRMAAVSLFVACTAGLHKESVPSTSPGSTHPIFTTASAELGKPTASFKAKRSWAATPGHRLGGRLEKGDEGERIQIVKAGDEINIRVLPGPHQSIEKTVKSGAKLHVNPGVEKFVKENNGNTYAWHEVERNGQAGWVKGSVLGNFTYASSLSGPAPK
jgi:hypothetical protein